MSTHYLNLTEAQKKRSSKDMTEDEKREVLDYLKAHPKDKEAIPYLMKKHQCSFTTLTLIIMEDHLT